MGACSLILKRYLKGVVLEKTGTLSFWESGCKNNKRQIDKKLAIMDKEWTAFTSKFQYHFVLLLHRYARALLQDCADKVDDELTNDNEGLTDRKSRATWRKVIAEVRNWDEAKWKNDVDALVNQAAGGRASQRDTVRRSMQCAIELGITQYAKDVFPHKTDISNMQLEELSLEDFLAFFVNAVLDQQASTSCGVAELDILECLRVAVAHAVPARDMFSSTTPTSTSQPTSSSSSSSSSSKDDDDVVSVPLKAASSDDDVAEPSYAKPKTRHYKQRREDYPRKAGRHGRRDEYREEHREDRKERRKPRRSRSRSRSRSVSPPRRATQEAKVVQESIKDRIKRLAKQPVDLASAKEAKGLDITSILDKKAK